MGIIFHIDVNSAFLSWSAIKMLREGSDVDLREIPSIVGGDQATRHGIVVAKSVPAKKYGIQTAEPVASAFRKCPQLVMVSPERSFYSQQSRMLMEYLADICPVIEQVSIDECYMDYEPIRGVYGTPEETAYYIKDSVRETFGFTINVGISDRKILAKMASDFVKPDKVHTLYHTEIQEKMWPLPIGELHMCGKSAAARFRGMGINTIGDLAQADADIISTVMKSHGRMLQRYAQGIDEAVVNPVRDKVKGVGNSTTLAKDVTQKQDAYKVLKKLSVSVSERLKKKEVCAESISVEIKYADFTSVSHQKSMAATNEVEDIYAESKILFDEKWDGEPTRLLGVRTTKLIDADAPTQMTLFDFQQTVETNQKKKQLDEALSKIRDRFGDDAIKKGW